LDLVQAAEASIAVGMQPADEAGQLGATVLAFAIRR
jgi:hypothetical protein